jgi:ABC-type spermidine/putrescine transport system permease subunit II
VSLDSVTPEQLVPGFHASFQIGAILVLAALVLAVVMTFRIRKQDKKVGEVSNP